MSGGEILPCRGVPHIGCSKTSPTVSRRQSRVFFFGNHSRPSGILRRVRYPLGDRLIVKNSGSKASRETSDDFVARFLRENPSQVEPRFLIGEKFLTLKEKENEKSREGSDFNLISTFKRFMNRRGDYDDRDLKRDVEDSKVVYLKDLLREFKGELYVPEEVFKTELSEEEEFERNLEMLPRMNLEDFGKYLKTGKIKLLTSKSMIGETPFSGFRDFLVDLEEIPGDKTCQRTKW